MKPDDIEGGPWAHRAYDLGFARGTLDGMKMGKGARTGAFVIGMLAGATLDRVCLYVASLLQ